VGVSAAPADAGPGTTFVVDLPAFSGPLDLLLALIRDERLDVYDIPIARVAEQFLAAIAGMALDEAADYLDMAARLVRIKAQLLLPRGAADEGWEDPRAELVRRLLEYQQVREVVDHLDRLGETRRGRFARGAAPAREQASHAVGVGPLAPARTAATLAELLSSVDRVLRAAREPVVHDVVPRALDVAGAIGLVRRLLTRRAPARWSDLVAADAEPWQLLSACSRCWRWPSSARCACRSTPPSAR
jgi:segregation and condensation protein A